MILYNTTKMSHLIWFYTTQRRCLTWYDSIQHNEDVSPDMILYNTTRMSHLRVIQNKWSWDICWSNCTLNQLQDTRPCLKSLHFLRWSLNSLLLCNLNVLHLFTNIRHLNLSWSSSVHSTLSHPFILHMQFSLYGDLHCSVSLMLRSTHPRH